MSKEHKHTPGPWMLDEDRPFDILYDDRDGDNVTPIIASVHTDNTDPVQWQADACLIVAAPETTQALEDLLRLFEEIDGGENDDAPEFVAARAAIAKARGTA